MNYNPRDIERIAKEISLKIENEISKAGIFYRIFYRCKEKKSLDIKINSTTKDGNPKYDGKEKLLRDIIGIRINLYFTDDLIITEQFIKDKFKSLYLEEIIDQNTTTEFKPTRINIIYKLPEEFQSEFREVVQDVRIEPAFELQLRTIISEGWHEVEHDLRYKCPDDWILYPELARTYNGFLASLETHEWGIIQLFERLSYSHYKSCDFSAMMRTKLRIRFSDFSISSPLKNILENKIELQKEFFKVERNSVVRLLLLNKIEFPPTLENIVYLINFFFTRSKEISDITPLLLTEYFKKYKEK